MSAEESKNLSRPDETIVFDLVKADMVTLGDLTVGRMTMQPGWRWSTHIKPVVGTKWCESTHIGVVLSGRAGVEMSDGTRYEIGPDDVYHIRPGHDGYVVGDEPVVTLEWTGLRGWAIALESMSERVLATILFTDIVDSTATASKIGDSRWHDVLAHHNSRVREVLGRFRGREVKTTGDGFLAVFDGAARGVRCAAELVVAAASAGVPIRAAVHAGEVEIVDDDLRGVAVHEAARVLGLAGPGEVLVTSVTRDLAATAGLQFEDRGEHELKGLTGPRRVFALRP